VPLAHREHLDPARVERWHRQVHALLAAVTAWVHKKKKHEAAGVALVTQLQCASLQWPARPPREFDAWVDKLAKWLKEKLFSDSVWLSC
jgi:hypothetical protein